MPEGLNFTKMHGLGNDFVLIDGRSQKLDSFDLPKLAQEICDRRFGIGGDGLLIVWPSSKADYRMQIFNPDGSEPEMCGNGIRCFTKYVYESSENKKDIISVETKAGVLVMVVMAEAGVVRMVEVDMGVPKDEGAITLQDYSFRKISMGNPHAVTFVEDLAAIDLEEIGPKIENDRHFPNRTNVEFARVMDRKEIELVVWERGAGITLACGTGACATAAAAMLAGKTDRRVLVRLPGGILDIEWESNDSHLVMRGPAEKVFEGRYYA